MIDTLRRAAMTRHMMWASMAAATVMIASPALSQAPTEAQRAAIKSSCRSDYMAHCASVPPGGIESLQCLQKNMSSLSSSCQTAVRAVAAPSETKAEPSTETPKQAPKEEVKKDDTRVEPAPTAAPARAAAEPAAEPAATPKTAVSSPTRKPSSAQIAAIRGACRSDYPKVCAGVPTGGAAALRCLEKNKSRVSAGCEKAVAAASGGGPASGSAASGGAPATEATATPAAAPAAPTAPALALRPMRPREILFVLRSACGADVRTLCAGVDPGGGRIIACLVEQSASLSPDCRGVLGQFAAQ